VQRTRKGRTLVGVHGTDRLAVEVALSTRGPVAGIAGSRPLFGDYDGWGPPADLQRVFTPEVRAMVLASPMIFEQVLVYGQDVVLVWRGIEADATVMKQALRLGAALCEAARRSVG
jgi:hypothetical protein